jgi:hypothetical protein
MLVSGLGKPFEAWIDIAFIEKALLGVCVFARPFYNEYCGGVISMHVQQTNRPHHIAADTHKQEKADARFQVHAH